MVKSELIKRLEQLIKQWREPTGWETVVETVMGKGREMQEYLRGKEAAAEDCSRDLMDVIDEAKD